MSHQSIETQHAPAPIGPYSQAIKAGDLLFLSGQVAIVPETGEVLQGSPTEETAQVMKNISEVLRAGGANFSNVVKTTIYLSDMAFFSEVNTEYGKYFDNNFPARETVAVKGLPKNVNVEISMIASLAE